MQSDIRHTRNLLLILFACFGFALPATAQSFSELDYVVKNKLYDFLIDYEKTVNATELDREKFKSFYYDTVVEVYNDLSQDLPQYIALSDYLTELKKIKQNQPDFKFFHYNLELDKQFKGAYYNTIQISLLREIEIDTTQNIEVSNTKINSTNFDITLIFNKYENNGNGAFKILKIEKADASILPGAWHQPLVPDEVKVSFGPAFFSFGEFNNPYMSTSDNIGFDASVIIQDRFYGGRNYAVSWFAGIGATVVNSTWALGYDSATINQTDAFGDEYKRIIKTRNVEQDISFSYLKIPLGISFKLFNNGGFSLSLAGEISPYYLLNSSQQTNTGEITYSGKYTLSNNGNNYDYLITNLGVDGYDFIPGNATTGRDEVLISEFGATAGISLQANIRITKNIDLFVGPSWKWGITDFLEANTSENLLSVYDWEANPIIEQTDGLRFNNTSLHAGLIFRLNNIVKPFVDKTKYKQKEKSLQNKIFNKYLAKQIPNDFPEQEETKKYRVSLVPDSYENHKYPRKVKYAFNKETSLKNKTIKVKSNNRLNTSYQGMFLFKPFGYDIFNPSQKSRYNAYDKFYIDSLHTDTAQLSISRLPDLNISVLMNLNNQHTHKVRDTIINKIDANLKSYKDQECALYQYKSHGITISDLYKTSEFNNYCFDCQDNLTMMDKIEKSPTGDDAEPRFNFINELRVLLKEKFTPDRRNINLIFYAANSDVFISAINSLQNTEALKTFSGKNWYDKDEKQSYNNQLSELQNVVSEHPVALNQFKNITFYNVEYDSDYHWGLSDIYVGLNNNIQDKFTRNTYRLLYHYTYLNKKDKRSIRLRNFEFFEIK